MRKSVFVGLGLGLIACTSTVSAAEPSVAKYWTSEDFASQMAPGVRKMLVDEKSHYSFIVHKEEGQAAETHETVAEFWIVMEGQAKAQVGGKMGPTKPRGVGTVVSDTLEGGTTYDLKKGGVLYIPIGVPHRVIVEKGQKLDFLMIKVDEAARGIPR